MLPHIRIHTAGAVAITIAALTSPMAPSVAAQDAQTLRQEVPPQYFLRAGRDRLVSGDEPELTHVEPHVVVSASAPEHIVAASIVFRDGRMTSEVMVSEDGGGHWERTRFPECAGDPWLAWGSAENVYFSCLAAGESPVGTLVFRSGDGGRSWSGPVELERAGGGSFDHTSMATYARPDSGDVIYLAGMQEPPHDERPPLTAPFVAVSRDGGRSFGEPQRIVWSSVMSNALNPVALSSDRMGVAFVDYSVDGQRPVEHRRLWWVHSRDRGRSFSIPHLVADATGATTIPTMGSSAGAGDEELLGLAYDNIADDRQGVYFVRSTDGGVSWSVPLPISVFPAASGRAVNPVTTVDAGGNVGVAWYEQPQGALSGCWEIRFTASTDGGATFLPSIPISGQTFCAKIGEVDKARRWPAGGDYFGLVARSPGVFQVMWADSRTGVYQVRTADVRIEPRS